MIGSLSLLAASSPESLWKGWRYGDAEMVRQPTHLHMRGQSQDRDGKSGIESVVRIH